MSAKKMLFDGSVLDHFQGAAERVPAGTWTGALGPRAGEGRGEVLFKASRVARTLASNLDAYFAEIGQLMERAKGTDSVRELEQIRRELEDYRLPVVTHMTNFLTMQLRLERDATGVNVDGYAVLAVDSDLNVIGYRNPLDAAKDLKTSLASLAETRIV